MEVLGRYVERNDGLADFRPETLMAYINENPDRPRYVPLWMMSIEALDGLGVENAPGHRIEPSGLPDDRPHWDAWRKWSLRVKEGRMSYKFEGDDRIYPTGTSAPPYAGKKRGPPGSRDRAGGSGGGNGASGRNAGAGPDSQEEGDGRHQWFWALGIAFLAAAGWWWVRSKKT